MSRDASRTCVSPCTRLPICADFTHRAQRTGHRVRTCAQQLGGKILARLGCKNAILYTPGQNRRPLINRLIRHADSLCGCSSRPSEQFNGR